jgi:hypothetical protein
VKKHSNSLKKSEPPMKRRNSRAEERRDPREVMAELVSQLREQLEVKSVPAAKSAGEDRDLVPPNLDRLTVGVDLGDQWSNYCILGLGGEPPWRGPVSDKTAGSWRVLSRPDDFSCGDRSRNAFGVDTGSDRRTRT